MPRTISSALQTQFGNTITAPGYLIAVHASQLLRWSNIGDINYQGVPWVDVDFEITGFKADATQDPSCSVRVQNLDNTIGGFFQNEKLVDVTIDIYQFERGALASGDAVQLVTMAIDDCTIGLDKLDFRLVGYASDSAFSPRRRIDEANGFSYALPDGTQIAWGNENFILTAAR